MDAIDLHSHILPGLDDGAPDRETSLAMADVAVAAGIKTMVATPHISYDYDFPLEDIGRRVGELNVLLARAKTRLGVLPGGEVALSRLARMTDQELRAVGLGGMPWVLVESPYTGTDIFIEQLLFTIQARGFGVVLAHPERSPLFQQDIERLRALGRRGVLASVNSGSMAGDFGPKVQRFALDLFAERLVHNVASDAHDAEGRPPRLAAGFERAEHSLPGLLGQADWFVRQAPKALLSGRPLPVRPDTPAPRPSLWKRLTRTARFSS